MVSHAETHFFQNFARKTISGKRYLQYRSSAFQRGFRLKMQFMSVLEDTSRISLRQSVNERRKDLA